MAESKPITSIVPLTGQNYPTWKLQCRMALMRDGLWGIVSGTETVPAGGADQVSKFAARRDRALATIVLAVHPSLLYLVGDPNDPIVVWTTLQNQFQKKTWANKLALRRRLHSLQLRDGESVQDHIKAITEVFNELAIVGDAIDEEDRVVYLLASLPDSFNTLVTALEANEDVPKMEVVTERLLHAERKQKERSSADSVGEKAMPTKRQFKGKCHYCNRYGHMQKNCTERIKAESKSKTGALSEAERVKKKFSKVGLVTSHVLGVRKPAENWIVDSGATCHICNSKELFDNLRPLSKPQKVTLGDDRTLEAIGTGAVEVELKLPGEESKVGRLSNVLYVPTLAYNLLSVAKVTEAGKTIKFGERRGEVIDNQGEIVAVASKAGGLYYLDCESLHDEQIHSVSVQAKENLWHQRFGHLGERNLSMLKTSELVDGFDYDVSKNIDFCESCVNGKIHRSAFPKSGRQRAAEPLGLVHSDLCGKISSPSLSQAEYFIVFIDDKTHYVWIYVIKHKHEVFQKFLEWKSFVEKSSGCQVKKLRTDNGGEYTSTEFENYLRKEGIEHQYTIPKTPEQNGVSERMNRTLVEAVRSMLADSGLPQKFWAEALSTAAYLINRSPTRSLTGKTPFEAWFGKKPNVKHLRVFGCAAYIHVPKDVRKKLDPKAKKCIFLGYGTTRKGYRLYDHKSSSIIHSRDIVFNELTRGHVSEGDKQLIQVESLPDNEPEEPEVEPADDGSPESESEVGERENDSRDSEREDTEAPALRRSTRESRRPDYYGVRVDVFTAAELQEPRTVHEALSCPEEEQWKAAMQKEMESIYSNDVWDLVVLPKDRKPVGSKWVFKKKTKVDGSIERYKARLVAQGFSQKPGLDYDETFSPVIRFESFRSLVAVAVQKGLKLHQLDITTAFLNGQLKEEVYMEQPEGFVEKGKEHLVCKLKQSLYGLKQSPRCWNSTLDAHLKGMGYVQSIPTTLASTPRQEEKCRSLVSTLMISLSQAKAWSKLNR